MRESKQAQGRSALTRDRVLAAAVGYADRHGLAALTMRKLGDELGVEAMSLYNHVANKSDLLDGMVDVVFAEIDMPTDAADWRQALRRRSQSARAVLAGHRWAIGLMETRTTPGVATLRHHDAVLGVLRRGGFSVADAAHAFATLDSYLYGFALQEATLPLEPGAGVADLAQDILGQVPAGEYQYLTEFMVDHAMLPGYDFANEFDFGLELILDGLEALVARKR